MSNKNKQKRPSIWGAEESSEDEPTNRKLQPKIVQGKTGTTIKSGNKGSVPKQSIKRQTEVKAEETFGDESYDSEAPPPGYYDSEVDNTQDIKKLNKELEMKYNPSKQDNSKASTMYNGDKSKAVEHVKPRAVNTQKVVKAIEDDEMDFDYDEHDKKVAAGEFVNLDSYRAEDFDVNADEENGSIAYSKQKSFVNSQQYEIDDEKLSYQKLKAHIQRNHPNDQQGNQYPICSEIGSLPCMNYCFKRVYDNKRGKEIIEITRIQQQIGLGPTLFLMTTKALAYLFLFLTLMNLPVYAFYYSGNESDLENESLNNNQKWQDIFAKLSLGNIGETKSACGSSNLVTQTFMDISCSYGQLQSINIIGISKNDDFTCKDLKASADEKEAEALFMVPDCYVRDEDIAEKEKLAAFQEYFVKNCKGKITCKLYLDETPVLTDNTKNDPQAENRLYNSNQCNTELTHRVQKSEYYKQSKKGKRGKNQDTNVPEPIILAKAECSSDFGIPFPKWIDKEKKISKEYFGIIVVLIDIAAVTSIIIFVYILDSRQNEFIDQFNNHTIMMSDYTVRIKYLPKDKEYGDKDEVLKALLWNHMESVLLTENGILNINNQSEVPLSCEIADINFGKQKLTDNEELMELHKLFMTKNSSKRKFDKAQLRKASQKKLQQLDDEFISEEEAYYSQVQLYRDSAKDLNTNEMQEQSVKYAYVTFRSMDAMNKVLNAYNVSWVQRFIYLNLCCACCCRKKQKHLKDLYFFNKWFKVTKACLPDEIKWENIGYSQRNRNWRKCVIWFIAIIMILAGILGVVLFKNKGDELKEQFNTNIICPATVNIKQAYYDHKKDKALREGLMHCFCLKQSEDLAEIYDNLRISFKTVPGAELDETLYCQDWAINYAAQQGMIIGTSVIVLVINVLICVIFELISKFEKQHTENELTLGQFSKITIMQYINITIILLIVNFHVGEISTGWETKEQASIKAFFEFFPIFRGDYQDFDSKWYFNIGTTLCLTLLLNIFTPHFSKMLMPCLTAFSRCWDRGCRFGIHNKKQAEPGIIDEVHTKKELQSDLQALYTGPQISSHYVYAQMFTNLWSCLSFSSGLPILYPFAMGFNFVLYWVYKYLLLKYYQRTSKFNEELAIKSIKFIKYGLMFHMIGAMLMYSNTDLLSGITAEFDDEIYSGYLEKGLKFTGLEGRFSSRHSQIYLVIFICIVFVFVFRVLIVQIILAQLYKVFTCGCCRKHRDTLFSAANKKYNFSEDIYNELEIGYLTELYRRSGRDLDEYKEIVKTFDHTALKVDEKTMSKHMDQLKARIKHIESAVDNHLMRLLKGNAKAPNPSQKKKYMSYNINDKLHLLLANQIKFQKIDQSRLRMQGLTQSYSYLDSLQYVTSKLMLKQLTKEEFLENKSQKKNEFKIPFSNVRIQKTRLAATAVVQSQPAVGAVKKTSVGSVKKTSVQKTSIKK